jgi:hypothetical protein
MALCPNCGAKVAPWKLWLLTKFNSVVCGACHTQLVANRTRSSLIGGIGGLVSVIIVVSAMTTGEFLGGFFLWGIWLIILLFITTYFSQLEVKKVQLNPQQSNFMTPSPAKTTGGGMVKRILLGFLWCVVIYFVACFVVGAVAGGIAGARDLSNSSVVGQKAGAEAVDAFRGLILLGSILISGLGTWAGILPGTKSKKVFLEQA